MIKYIKMIGVIRCTHWVILIMKHPRIWLPPTQIQSWSKNFKIGLPGNWTKVLMSSESEFFTESFPVFWNKKIVHAKKLCPPLIPEFILTIQYRLFCMHHIVWWCLYIVDVKNPHKLWKPTNSISRNGFESVGTYYKRNEMKAVVHKPFTSAENIFLVINIEKFHL